MLVQSTDYVFIVSYEIAKRVKEITRGSVMGRYFNDQ